MQYAGCQDFLPVISAKQEYLYRNQVGQAIFEGLLVAVEFCKPEILCRFYLGLLDEPGREINVSRLSKDIKGKYRATLNERELSKSREIAGMLGCGAFITVCKDRPDDALEKRLQEKSKIPLVVIPLAGFLLPF